MDSSAETEQPFQPPYMAWTTFDSIVDQFRANGLPAQIDRSVLRSRSGGDQSQFLRAASRFGFIDGNGTPTQRFREYVGNPEGRPQIMAEVLSENYPEVVALPEDATPQMLADEFRKMGVEGDTARKATRFFLSAARFAGLPLSPHFQTTRPGAGGRKSPRRSSSARTKDSQTPQTPQPPVDPTAGLHPAIVTLVQSLPPAKLGEKPIFSNAERTAWFAYAKATFNLIYSRPDGEEEPQDES